MTKLVNHVGHFPMGGGAAQLNSNVLETDDSATLEGAELATEIFNAPNVQVRGFTGCCFSWKLLEVQAKNMSGKVINCCSKDAVESWHLNSCSVPSHDLVNVTVDETHFYVVPTNMCSPSSRDSTLIFPFIYQCFHYRTALVRVYVSLGRSVMERHTASSCRVSTAFMVCQSTYRVHAGHSQFLETLGLYFIHAH